MRKMVADAESRSQTAHKKSLEAANEVKRLLPLEGKAVKLEEQLAASKADVDRCLLKIKKWPGSAGIACSPTVQAVCLPALTELLRRSRIPAKKSLPVSAAWCAGCSTSWPLTRGPSRSSWMRGLQP
jgi:hypothetical protein